MALIKGNTTKAVVANIRTLLMQGKSREDAIATALDYAQKTKRKRAKRGTKKVTRRGKRKGRGKDKKKRRKRRRKVIG